MRLAIFALALLGGCSAVAARTGADTTAVRVIDGDTIALGAERIRVSNIDAPEMPAHARCWAEAALAVQAKDGLEAEIKGSPDFAIVREGKDRYGRTLARLRGTGTGERVGDIGERLVGYGLAVAWIGHRWDWCGSPETTGWTYELSPN